VPLMKEILGMTETGGPEKGNYSRAEERKR
jgi:hypothetical protein